MGKTIKYELRRNLSSYIVLLVIFGLIEAGFIIGIFSDNSKLTAITFVLLMFASFAMYFYVLFSSVSAYKRDIETKQGFMVFMTPVSTFSIIGAKLIVTLITGFGCVLLIGLCFALDWHLLLDKVAGLENFVDIMNDFMKAMNIPTDKILLAAVAAIFVFLLSFYLLVTLAYLAVSLSNTLLSNKKGKGLIGFVFFIVLYILVTVISNKLPHPIDSNDVKTIWNAFFYNLPQYLFHIVSIVLSFLGSAWLLNNKINL